MQVAIMGRRDRRSSYGRTSVNPALLPLDLLLPLPQCPGSRSCLRLDMPPLVRPRGIPDGFLVLVHLYHAVLAVHRYRASSRVHVGSPLGELVAPAVRPYRRQLIIATR